MQALQIALYLVGLPLEVLVTAAMVRSRAWREFPFVFTYAVALLAASLVELPLTLAYFTARTRKLVYWANEGLLQILMFALVISLIYAATRELEQRTKIRRALIAGAVLFAPISLAIHYSPNVAFMSHWATLVTRDLSLCSAVLDLALWMLLLAFRRGDHRLLLISGGLGIQFTGEAIGHSLRQISRPTAQAGSVIVVLANLTCLYVWWQTFRKVSREEAGCVDARPAL